MVKFRKRVLASVTAKLLHNKYYALVLVLLMGSVNSMFAQVKIGKNPAAVNSGAVLELESANKGLLLPRIQDTLLIPNAPDGMFVYVTNLPGGPNLYIRQSQVWQSIPTNNTINNLLLSFLTGNVAVRDSLLAGLRSKADSLATRGFLTAQGGDSSVFKKVILGINMQAFRDSVASAITGNTTVRDNIINNLKTKTDSIATRGFLTATGGDSSVMKKVILGIDPQRFRDSVGSVFTNSVSIKDSVLAGLRTKADSVVTSGFLTAIGGDSSVLKKVTLGVNAQRFRDSIATAISSSTVIKDSLLAGLKTKSDSLTTRGFLTVTGGDSSVLKKVIIGVDLQRFRDSVGSVFTNSVSIKDSVLAGLRTKADSVVTSGFLTAIGGDSSVLKKVTLGVNAQRFRDSIATAVSSSTVIKDSLLSGLKTKSDSLTTRGFLTVTGGDSSVLKKVIIGVDLQRFRDSVGSVFTNSVSIKDSVLAGLRTKADSVVTSGFLTAIGGDSSVLKKVTLGVNAQRFRDSIATAISSAVIKDSLLAAVRTKSDSIGTRGFLTVTGGDSSVLKKVVIGIDRQRFRDSVAVALFDAPVKDSLSHFIRAYSDTAALRANLPNGTTSDSLVVVNGGQLRKIPVESLLIQGTGLIDPVGIYQAVPPATVFPGTAAAYPGNGNVVFAFNEVVKLVYNVAGARPGDVVHVTTSPTLNDALVIGRVVVAANNTVVVTVINSTEAVVTPTDLKLTLGVIKLK